MTDDEAHAAERQAERLAALRQEASRLEAYLAGLHGEIGRLAAVLGVTEKKVTTNDYRSLMQ